MNNQLPMVKPEVSQAMHLDYNCPHCEYKGSRTIYIMKADFKVKCAECREMYHVYFDPMD